MSTDNPQNSNLNHFNISLILDNSVHLKLFLNDKEKEKLIEKYESHSKKKENTVVSVKNQSPQGQENYVYIDLSKVCAIIS